MLSPFANHVAYCCVLLGVVVQSLKPVKLLLGQQCWELLRPSALSCTFEEDKHCFFFFSSCFFHDRLLSAEKGDMTEAANISLAGQHDRQQSQIYFEPCFYNEGRTSNRRTVRFMNVLPLFHICKWLDILG